MALPLLRPTLAACLTVSMATAAALAQASDNYTSVEATPDKPVQLSYHASAHKSNCTPAPLPSVRVTETPKEGMLTVRRALLTTNKIAGCPALKTPAQVVFYQAKTGYQGADHVRYEVTSENGEVATYDVAITVKEAPLQQNKPSGEAGSQRL